MKSGVGVVDVVGRCLRQRHSVISRSPSRLMKTTVVATRPQMEHEPLQSHHASSANPGETSES